MLKYLFLGILGEILNLSERITKKSLFIYVLTILVLYGGTFVIVENTDRYESVCAAGEKRVEIENRQYADAIFVEYKSGRYHVILSFNKKDGGSEFREYNIKDMYKLNEEYGKSSNMKLDFFNVQAIVADTIVMKDGKLLRNLMEMLDLEKQLPDNTNVFCNTN